MNFKEFLVEDQMILQENMLTDLISDLKDSWKESDKPEKIIMAGLLATTLTLTGVLGYGIKASVEDSKNLQRIETEISQNIKRETQENFVKKYENHLKLKADAEKVIYKWVSVWDPNTKRVEFRPMPSHDAKAVAAYQQSIKEFAELYHIDLKE